MTVVGTAELVIVPNTAGFAAMLDAESDASFAGFKKNAERAGDDAGAGLRGGVKREAGKLDDDLGEIGLVSGARLRKGVKDGTSGLENDLSDLGGLAGGNLRKGMEEETRRLEGDMERDGAKGGEGLAKGASSGLSKLASLISNTGLPLGGLSMGLEKSAGAAEHLDEKSSGLMGTLDKVGGVALVGVGVGLAATAAESVHLAEGMQTADASIANSAGISTKAATEIGNAFLGTAFKSTFSGKEMAKVYGEVAGQLTATEGHALSTGEAFKVMSAASHLAEATQSSLGEATGATSQIIQAFGLKAVEAGHVTDVLFRGSEATKQSVEGLASQLTKLHSKLGEASGSIGQMTGLLVDMTERGVTGRAAMAGLNTGLNTLLKSANGVTTAVQAQNAAYASLSPQLKALARQYQDGSISSEAFKKETQGLPPAQEAAVAAFTKASTTVQTAQLKYKEMGLTVFDAQGKFVGMGSIIEQLNPRFAKMTQQQQLATASTLFGAGAARQMTEIIKAGPEAYDKATRAVEKHGQAEAAAKKQAETLHGEEQVLSHGFEDLATKLGQLLIPMVTRMMKAFAEASEFVLKHKEVLVALASVVTGVLGAAITVFTVNKMKAFAESFVGAGRTLGIFAAEATTTAGSVEGAGTAMVGAADTTAAGVDTALGATGVGLILVGVGIAATELAAHWKEILAFMEEAAKAAANFIIGQLNEMLEGIEEVTLGLVKLGKIGEVGTESRQEKGIAKVNAAIAGHPQTKQEAEASGVEILSSVMSKAAAEGVVKALSAESEHFNPAAKNPESGAYGVAQWLGSRKEGLEAFAKQQGKPISDLAVQLEYIVHELQTGEHGTLSALKGVKTPQEATDLWVKMFERPGSAAEGAVDSAAAGIPNAGGRGGRGREVALTSPERGTRATERAAEKVTTAHEREMRKLENAHERIVQAEMRKVTADQKAGTAVLNKMLTAIHSGSLKQLESTLYQVHLAGLAKIEKDLDADHKSALKKLADRIVAVHKQALEDLTRKLVALQKEQNEKKQIATDTEAEKIKAQEAANESKQIADEAKVAVDRHDEQGLTGAEWVAAKAQTALDELTQREDLEIGRAKLAVVADVGGSPLSQEEAKRKLTEIEAHAEVEEAHAQAMLDLAKAAEKTSTTVSANETTATTPTAPPTPTAPAAPAAPAPTNINITITGSNITAQDVMEELSWQAKTGALPIAPPEGSPTVTVA
jgi:hypothetical protein